MSIAEDLADKIFHTATGVDSDTLFEALSLAIGGAAVLAVAALEDHNNPFKLRIVQSAGGCIALDTLSEPLGLAHHLKNARRRDAERDTDTGKGPASPAQRQGSLA